MAYNISNSVTSNMTNVVEDVSVNIQHPEGASNQKETEYTNPKFTQWFGYYKEIPEVKTAIDTRAIWTIGDGYKADARTTAILDNIKGWGTDTFDSILENAVVIKRVGGDAYIEIIRGDNPEKTLINLKPLDPSTMKTIVDPQGIIIRYEQVSKLKHDKGKTIQKFNPEDILHFTNKRVADEIHGVSDIEAVEQIILANKESFTDTKRVQHLTAFPRFAFQLDTDDPVKIEEFAAKMDNAVKFKEHIYIPKGSVEFELISVPANATSNPLPWREHLRNYFFQVVGIPQIIMGSSGEFTESTAKIAYLAFEQSVKSEQREMITQIWNKLNLRIDLAFPASLKNEMLSDENKDAAAGTSFKQSDTTAGVGA